jgi:hypothetical protein
METLAISDPAAPGADVGAPGADVGAPGADVGAPGADVGAPGGIAAGLPVEPPPPPPPQAATANAITDSATIPCILIRRELLDQLKGR